MEFPIAPNLCSIWLTYKAKIFDKLPRQRQPTPCPLAGLSEREQFRRRTVDPRRLLQKRKEPVTNAEEAPIPEASRLSPICARGFGVTNIRSDCGTRGTMP